MPGQMSEQERDDFLLEPHVGVLSVANDNDRPPHTVPLFYGYEPGGTITFFTGTQQRKARKTALIQKSGVVTLCVQREDFPYRYVTVEGTVLQADQPPSAEQMLAVVRRYMQEEAAQGFVNGELDDPENTVVLFTIRPDRWLTADFSD